MTPHDSAEQLIIKRLERAEQLLALQRQHVREREELGLDLADARALLQLMEAVAQQFYVTWQLFQAYRWDPAPAGAAPPDTDAAGAACSAAASLRQAVTARSSVPCPHCGLHLGLEGHDGSIVYDMGEWSRRCRYQALQTPALCQLLHHERQTVH